MKDRSDLPTFVGPITKEKVQPRLWRISFLVLQATKDCSPIMLEYGDRETAIKSREQLLTLPNTFRVGSNKLLSAIQMAINKQAGG